MFPFAPIRPRVAGWRGWLPALALPLFMFIALLALGGDRGYFYREGAAHNFNTAKVLAIAENLSPEHNFRLALRIWHEEDGGFGYELYSRFPVGSFLLVKLAALPFGNDLAAKLLAARVLMLLMFCGAAALAYLAIARATGSRSVALAAATLAFSGSYALYYADTVFNESVMDLFGAALVFHGMAVFVQEGRFRQLLVKTCAALLLGWHVYALLLPFIALGFGGEAIALLRSARASKPNERAKAARAAITSLARSRYVALAAVAILFGSALLALNFANEYMADGGGQKTLSDLPSARSALRRFGLTEDYSDLGGLEWGNFIRRQLYRVGVTSAPYALARAVGYDFPVVEPPDPPLAPTVWGAAAAVLALAAVAFARRRRVLLASAVLFGFCWAVIMRHNVFVPSHNHEAVHYLWTALALFALALTVARRLMGARRGDRLALAVAAAAAVVFATSVFHSGRERDASDAEWDKTLMADFSAIREIARGKSLVALPRHVYTFEYQEKNYYMSGIYWAGGADGCDPRVADFVASRYRDESLNLLTPDNRAVFLYENTSPLELCRAERRRIEASEPAARADYDVYLQDGALRYLKAPCEPRGDDDFFAYVYPADPNVLPDEHRRNGFYPTWWGGKRFAWYGAAVDDACIMTLHLPDWPIAAIRTGQATPGGEIVWDVFITPPPSAEAQALYEKAYQAISSSGEPAARSGFDLYLDGDTLSYLKAPCGEGDTRGRIFLSVHPADVRDLPADRREIGHESLNFTLAPPAGAVFNDKCMATRQLPDYDIARIETGQWIPGGERLWDAELVVGD